MPQVSTQAHWVDVSRSSRLRSMLQRIGDAVRQRRRAARHRGVLATLSDAQLEDAGIDPAIVRGNRPIFAVDPRLTIYLASLR